MMTIFAQSNESHHAWWFSSATGVFCASARGGAAAVHVGETGVDAAVQVVEAAVHVVETGVDAGVQVVEAGVEGVRGRETGNA